MHLMILAALMWFKQNGIRLVVFENGVGGRADPSNILNPIIACLTEMTLDHQDLLGPTLEDIVADKAAIVKQTTQKLILGSANADVRRLVRDHVANTTIVALTEEYTISGYNDRLNYRSEYHNVAEQPLHTTALFQKQNAGTALAALEALMAYNVPIHWERALNALSHVQIPCRYEKRTFRDGLVLIDGAHNPYEMETLMKAMALDKFIPDRVVLSLTTGRSSLDMLKPLSQLNASFDVIASPFKERRMPKAEIHQAFTDLGLSWTYYDHLDLFLQTSPFKKQQTLITGSLYLAGVLRTYIIDADRKLHIKT
ncbi:hypothetical protein G4V62_11210 [Bacillaceae bacterium SIJ1]|uniref:Mur ligase family protein n=1 Tax=Litoribacterium kuwaitense TaxID=1398745 RepID=UPI0013ECB108|nr:Mur ligase family protein [Litoribacterium kuwaitense]NGP45497.1 hypothetical protein [Litoribacterium kuwaitense]